VQEGKNMASKAQFCPIQRALAATEEVKILNFASADWGLGTYFGADSVLIGVTSLPKDYEIWRLQIL